jgi:hypothetical protein
MVQSEQPQQPKSHVSVQQFNDSVELLQHISKKGLKILYLLGIPDNTAQGIIAQVPCSKALVSHWKDYFIKIGALRLNEKSDVAKYYDLTPFGSKLLAMSEAGFVGGHVYVLEDYAWKFDLLRDAFQDSPVDWRRYGMPKNWVRMGVLFSGVRVILNRGIIPTVEIHPGKIRDFDPYCLLATAGEIVGMIKAELAARHGIVLSDVGVPLHKPIWQVYTDKAAFYPDVGNIKVDLGNGDTVTRDKSPPDRKWHKEFNNIEMAVAEAETPKLLVNLKHEVSHLKEQVHFLAQENVQVVSALNVEISENRSLRESFSKFLDAIRDGDFSGVSVLPKVEGIKPLGQDYSR